MIVRACRLARDACLPLYFKQTIRWCTESNPVVGGGRVRRGVGVRVAGDCYAPAAHKTYSVGRARRHRVADGCPTPRRIWLGWGSCS